MKSKIGRVILVAGMLGFALLIAGCGESEEQKADKLYESNLYAEALEIYDTLANKDSEEVSSKISDCQFWLFIDYVRENGSITIERSGHSTALPMTTKVEARESGEIKLTYIDSAYTSLPSSNTGISDVTTYTLSIPHEGKEATIEAEYRSTTSGAKATQTAKGILDIGTYKIGDTITWDDYTDNVSTGTGFSTSLGVNVLETNAKDVQKMINDLSNCLVKSGTGCKLKTIGFDKL